MRRVLLGMGVLALLATAPAVSAQQQSGNFDGTMAGDAARQNGLEVEMTRLRQGNDPTGGARQRVCPLVRGASDEVNAYVASRLRQVANDVGAQYANQRCEPNMVVLFSSEPQKLVDEASRAGRFNYNGVTPQKADAFRSSTQPVRWMHGSATPRLKTKDTRPYNSLVVVDANKAAGVKVSALADYVSMVTLAEAPPSGGSSILNLFDEGQGAAPAGMTDADRAYLRGVYARR